MHGFRGVPESTGEILMLKLIPGVSQQLQSFPAFVNRLPNFFNAGPDRRIGRVQTGRRFVRPQRRIEIAVLKIRFCRLQDCVYARP